MPKEVIETPKMKLPPGLPFAKGIKKGNHIYVSGTLPFNELGEFVGEGDVHKQTEQILKNVLAIVENAGGNLDDIVKMSVFMKSVSDFDEMNRAYVDFFGNFSFPARTTVEANLVFEHFLVEIEAVAILG